MKKKELKQLGGNKFMITNITGPLAPYLRGKISGDRAVADVYNLYCNTLEREIFVCENCGKTIYPDVVTNGDGILIISNRAELRGGKGNHCIQRNICEECAKKMGIIKKGSFKNEENH